MSFLHNRVNNAALKAAMLKETEPRVTLSFYQYFPIESPQDFRNEWFMQLTKLKVFGRIYIAHEGVNAQVSVPANLFDDFKKYLYSHQPLNNLRLNVAVDDDGKSFWVLRIKVRSKIVADGITDPTFSMENKGEYLDAKTFNSVAENPDTVIVDMRNHYEYEVGHINNAIEIPSDTFREQLPMAVDMLKDKKDKTIVMYCTGGIRCEKASAFLKHEGFKNVFHLEGGIIEYTNKARALGIENKFIGKNFVFDERLGERISDDIIAHCHQCGAPCDDHTNCANNACHLLFIQCKSCAAKYDGCCSQECKDFKALPAEVQKEQRKGLSNDSMIFNKHKRSNLRPRLNEE